jgi:hypothetical protein
MTADPVITFLARLSVAVFERTWKLPDLERVNQGDTRFQETIEDVRAADHRSGNGIRSQVARAADNVGCEPGTLPPTA